MTISDYEEIIYESKKSLGVSQKLFNEIITITVSNTGQNTASIEKDEKNQKIYYMSVALLCSEWESFYSKIYFSDKSDFKNFTRKVFKSNDPWHKKELQVLRDLRNCIMHHGGIIGNHYEWIKNNKKGEILFDQKYLDSQKKYINFSNINDVNDFFQLIDKSGLDFYLERIKKYIYKNVPTLHNWRKHKLYKLTSSFFCSVCHKITRLHIL